jgi:hypothetical protein
VENIHRQRSRFAIQMECDRFKIFKFRETPGTSRDRTIEIDRFVLRAHIGARQTGP